MLNIIKLPVNMEDLQHQKLINRKHVVVNGNDILRHLQLLIYIFSNEETANIDPLLNELKLIRQESIRRNLGIEIVYVPLGHNHKSAMTHFSRMHGNWFAVPAGDDLIGELIFKYGIIKNPTVVVIRKDGSIVSYDAEPEIMKIGLNVLVTWSKY